jgi:hypothetical protein
VTTEGTAPPNADTEWNPVEVEAIQKSVRLYLDDVDEILKVFRSLGAAAARAERDNTWRRQFISADDLAEMLTKNDERSISGLILSPSLPGKDRSLTVRLVQPVQIVYFPPDDAPVQSAVHKLVKLLSRREVRNGGVSLGADTLTKAAFRQIVLVGSLFVILGVISGAVGAVGMGHILFPALIVVLLGILSVLLFAIRRIFFSRNPSPLAEIVLRRREEPLRHRLKEPIVANAISYLLGAITALVAGYFLQLFDYFSK